MQQSSQPADLAFKGTPDRPVVSTKLLHLFALPFSAFLYWFYVRAWVGVPLPEMNVKPFAYRAFVPILSELIARSGLRLDIATLAIIAVSLIGFIVSLEALYRELIADNDRAILFSYVAAWGLVLLIMYNRKIYDMTSMFFVTLALLFLAREQFKHYAFLFPLMCINRETTLFFIFIFAIYYWRKMPFSCWLAFCGAQVIVFGAIQGWIRLHYAGLGGQQFTNLFMDNLRRFAGQPILTVLMVAAFGVVGWLVARNWEQKPVLLRVAFWCMFPVLFILYFVTNYSFEIRTMAELYPVVVLLIVRV